MVKLTNDGIERALRKHHGNQAAAARAFRVHRSTISRRVAASEALKAVLTEARESMKDDAEGSLHEAVKRGESWAVCFYLKCQAKDRGYVERTEHRHGGDEDAPPIRINWDEMAKPKAGVVDPVEARIAAAAGTNGHG